MQAFQRFLIVSAVVVIVDLCAYGAFALQKNQNNAPPHILFILADDMGWNDVSFHGADQISTPNIDALAYNGVILNRHYVLPICTPSRTALMTGRYAIREGMQGWPLKAGEPRGIPLNRTLMPEYLRRLGYSTRLVGKWHVGYLTKGHTPARRGFESFYGYYNGFINYFDHGIVQDLHDGTLIPGHDFHRDDAESLNPTYDSGYFTELITDEAEKIIKSNGNSKPLFLEISHLSVHASLAENPLEVPKSMDVNTTFSYVQDQQRRDYAGMMKALDDSVGRVVTALSEAKMLENSIIIFMSDNGAPTVGIYQNAGSNYPMRGIKATLFEGSVRGAACIFSPLIKSPSHISEQMIHITDWLPTLYAAAGGNPADIGGIDGFNQWQSIVRGTKSPRDSMLLNIDEVLGMEAAIIGRHKLLKDKHQQYQDYYGESGNDPSYPTYHVEDALSSPTGLAISRLTGFVSATPGQAQKLRERSTVRCKATTTYANCSTLCLFDIIKDPCETQDLSKQRPKVVKALETLIEDYRKGLMAQTNPPVDPCSFPKYFNGSWMPWRKDDILPVSPICQHLD